MIASGYLSNFHVHGREQAQVGAAVRFGKLEPAWLSPRENDWVGVFPRAAESHDPEALNKIGLTLSRTLDTAVLGLLVHDSRSFFYTVFHRGEIAAEYDSFPELTGVVSSSYRRLTDGNPRLLLQLVNSDAAAEAVEAVLFRKPLSEAIREIVIEEKMASERELMDTLPESYVQDRIRNKRGYSTEDMRLRDFAAVLKISRADLSWSLLDKMPREEGGAKGFVLVDG